MICSIFLPVEGGAGHLRGGSVKPGATFPENMAGIWLRGRWVSSRQEEGEMSSLWEGVLCVEGRKGLESVPNSPPSSL